jgi:hypothetical protein
MSEPVTVSAPGGAAVAVPATAADWLFPYPFVPEKIHVTVNGTDVPAVATTGSPLRVVILTLAEPLDPMSTGEVGVPEVEDDATVQVTEPDGTDVALPVMTTFAVIGKPDQVVAGAIP